MFVPSEKQADRVPEELFDAAAGQCVTTANFSKNQLTSIPSRYEDDHSEVNVKVDIRASLQI